MSGLVADTHTALWYLAADPRLSGQARAAMERVTDQNEPIFIPTICLVEATYLLEKNRIEAKALLGFRHASAIPVPLLSQHR